LIRLRLILGMTVRWFIWKRRPCSLVVVPFIAAVAAAGTFQAGATGLSEEDRSAINRLLGEGVLGPALPAAPIGETATLIPLAPATRIFRLSSGPDVGTTETDVLRASTQEGSDASWQYAAGRRSVYNLRSTDDGSIVIPSEQDLALGVVTRYDPPQPLIIRGIRPDEQTTLSIAVKVSDLDDPVTVVHSGWLSVSYTYVGRYRVTVPAGTYPAVLIKWQYHGEVGLAGFKGSEYWFFADGLGPIAMIGQRRISALLFYKRDTKYGKVLQGMGLEGCIIVCTVYGAHVHSNLRWE
jgi:hypothetical protein